MLPRIRKRVTYTNVAMTLALVFAMSGGAYAASRYVITSTKQISPKVLKALAGKPGNSGAPGATGPTGSQGPTGPQGPAGQKGETGTNGTNGESVAIKAEGSGAHCAEGGESLTVGGKTGYACNKKAKKDPLGPTSASFPPNRRRPAPLAPSYVSKANGPSRSPSRSHSLPP